MCEPLLAWYQTFCAVMFLGNLFFAGMAGAIVWKIRAVKMEEE